MKHITLLFGIILFTACRPESSNDMATLSEVFSNSQIRIEMETCGCFGCGDTILKITKADKHYIVTGDDVEEDLEISQEQFIQIKEYIKSKTFPTSNFRGLCTANTEYRIGSYWTYIQFNDDSCRVLDDLMKIMK